jgi:dihydroneopterin aldolase
VSDRVLISGLRVKTHVGWTSEERAVPQFVLVDLDIETDLAAPSSSDDLGDTLDYAALISEVAEYVAAQDVRLLERLAGELAEMLSAKDGVKRVTVEVAKERVPVPEEVARVAVRVTRSG